MLRFWRQAGCGISCAVAWIALVCLPAPTRATPLVPSSDMTYLGAFKLPALPAGNVWRTFDGAGYNLSGMAFVPANNSLLVMGGPGNTVTTRRMVAEVSIPALQIDTYANLSTATLLHGLVDIIGADNTGTYCHLGDVHYFAGQGTQSSDKIYVSVYGSYSTQSIYQLFNGMFAWTETDLDNLNLQGWWRFTDPPGSRYVGKYLLDIPTAWADAHVNGKYLAAGLYRGGGGAALGPTLYAFAPWEHCPGDCDTNPPPDAEDGAAPDATGTDPVPPELKHTLDHHTLLQYQGASPLFDDVLRDAAPRDRWNDAAWVTVGSKSALVILGWKACRAWADYRWQYPNAPAFVGTPGEGYHDEPGRPVLVFFDPDDLADVAGGVTQPYEPQPYAMVELTDFFFSGNGYTTEGMAYDPAANILYLRESGSATHAIHAFQLADVGASLDTTPPSAPVVSIDSVSHESVSLSWTAATDDRGGTIVYQVFKNGAPIAVQTTTSFADTYYEWSLPPVEYHVVAFDFEGNPAQSNAVLVDESVGGNAPLNFFSPSLGGSSSEHETLSLPLLQQSLPYSFSPTAIGGVPPLTWSGSGFPSGLTVDPSTGVISGTVSTIGSHYGPSITLTDNAGNLCRRRVKIKIVASSNDQDDDGYTTATDPDDMTINVHPGNPIQPPPTSLQVTGRSGASVTLSWTAAPQRQDIGNGKEWRKFQGEMSYEVHRGSSAGVYSDSTYVGRATTRVCSGLPAGQSYFAVTAYDFRGLQSTYSNEVVVNNDTDGGADGQLGPDGGATDGGARGDNGGDALPPNLRGGCDCAGSGAPGVAWLLLAAISILRR